MSDRIEIKPDGSWIFHGEDSRLRDPGKNEVTNYRVWNPLEKKFEYRVMHRVYCLNCGADGGLTARTALYVKYICEEKRYRIGVNMILVTHDKSTAELARAEQGISEGREGKVVSRTQSFAGPAK